MRLRKVSALLLAALLVPAARAAETSAPAAEVAVSTDAANGSPGLVVKDDETAPKKKPLEPAKGAGGKGIAEGPVFETLLWGSAGAVAGSLAGPPGAIVGAAVGSVIGFGIGLVMKHKMKSPTFRDSKKDAKGP